MFRSTFAVCVLALASFSFTPSVQADVVAKQMAIRLPTITGTMVCFSEEAADSMLQGMPWGAQLNAQRELFRTELRRRMGRDVMLLTVVVQNDSSSTSVLEVEAGDVLNIKRNDQVITGFGVLYTIDVFPGELRATFAVFGRLNIEESDTFFIQSKSPGH